jgi:cystathionine beta-lyase
LRRGVLICSDEIHCDIVYSGHRHIPIASLDPEISQNTITLMSPSKTFNLAGLQASFAVVQNPHLRAQLEQAGRGLMGWVNLLGQTAMLAAYRDCQGWLDSLLVYLEGNRDCLAATLHAELPQISFAQPEGTYLAWLDCRRAGIEGNPGIGDNPYEFFLNKARVALQDGADFGAGGEGFVRMNFGCPRSLLGEALERMKAALK